MPQQVVSSSYAMWSPYILAVAMFIVGSWVVPKMEFIPNTLKIWIFAFGVGLLFVALLLNTTVQKVIHLDRLISNNTWMIVAAIGAGVVVMVGVGLFVLHADRAYQSKEQLRKQTDELISDISQFVADRMLSQPTPTDPDLADVWFQRSREYRASTDNLFVSRFQQRIMDIGYQYRQLGIMSDEDWRHFSWVTQPEYPVISWVLDALKEYRSRLK